MPIVRHRRPVLAVLGFLVIPLGAAACATPLPGAFGRCGLVVADTYGHTNLEPPYEVTMILRSSGDEARVTLMGTGWGPARFSMTGPGKTIATEVDAGSMNNPMDWIMPAAGTWHFRMTDGRCTRDFDVEVKSKV